MRRLRREGSGAPSAVKDESGRYDDGGMHDELRWIAKVTGAERVRRGERIQSLWSGYGEIFRVYLIGASMESVVVKWVKPPARPRSRLGGAEAEAASHARKCRSYDVETAWYRAFAPRCEGVCRVASLVDRRVANGQWLLVLEDLDAAG